ncbi:MAG: ribonuclease HII [Deltaproteobacteria bacterium]|nr:ribonuclease HII [Deltaproteobacteria bacterium]
MMWMGVDEAGRGSVLGPMAVGAYMLVESRLPELVATGVTDSKALTQRRREALIPALEALGEPRVRLVPAQAIDRGNLNEITLDVVADLVREARPDRVWVDAPCNPRGIPTWIRRLYARLPYRPQLVVEPKADARYPLVGAASVCAKVARDAAVRALGPVGSGYPSDPTTRAVLTRLLQEGRPLPPWVRSRWGTLAILAGQAVLAPRAG